MILWMLAAFPAADAQQLAWELGTLTNTYSSNISCSGVDDRPLAPSAHPYLFQAAGLTYLTPATSQLNGTTHWSLDTWSVRYFEPHGNTLYTMDIGALCGSTGLFDCLLPVTYETAPSMAQVQEATVRCPRGSYLISGGAELVGDHLNAGLVLRQSTPAGLLWPTTYRVSAERIFAWSPQSWSIRVFGYCADASVMDSLSLLETGLTIQESWWGGTGNPQVGDPFDELGVGYDFSLGQACPDPVSGGIAARSPNVVSGVGWLDDAWMHVIAKQHRPGDPAAGAAIGRLVCSDDLDQLSADLAACAGIPSPPPSSPFSLPVPPVAESALIKLVDDNSGVILVPPTGPVPSRGAVGSLSFRDAAAALRVGLVPVTPSLREAVISEITNALTAEGTPWTRTTEISTTPGVGGVTIVVPTHEQRAVDWLRDHRGDFAGHPGLVLLVLDHAGRPLSTTSNWR